MTNNIVELDFACPECGCSQWESNPEADCYYCLRCGYWLPADNNDQVDEEELKREFYRYFDPTLCNKCSGGGLIQVEGELRTCPRCGGTGSHD